MPDSIDRTSMYGIKIEAPNGTEQTFPVEFDIVLIGSSDGNNIILRDPTIDLEHLQVDFEPGAVDPEYVVVTDLSSSTGTLIGTTPLAPEQPTIWPADQVVYIGPFKLSLSHITIGEIAPLPPYGTSDAGNDSIASQDGPEYTTIPNTYEATGANARADEAEPYASDAALFTNMVTFSVAVGNEDGPTHIDVPYVVVNQSDETDLFSLLVNGIPSDWHAQLPSVMLAPGSQADVVIRYLIPMLSKSGLGDYPIEIVAYSEHGDYRSAPLRSTMTVAANPVAAELPPTPSTEPPQDQFTPSDFDQADFDQADFDQADVDQTSIDETLLGASAMGAAAMGLTDDSPTESWNEWEDRSRIDRDERSDNESPELTPRVGDIDDEQDVTPSSFTAASRRLAFGEPQEDASDDFETYQPPGYEPEPYSAETIGSSMVPPGYDQPGYDQLGYSQASSSVDDDFGGHDPTELGIRQFMQDGSSDLHGINKDVVVVGNGDEDDIRIDEVGVAAHHLEVHVEDDNIYVIPRTEATGVFIGRAKAPEDQRTLWPTDKLLHIGPYVRLGLEQAVTATSLVELYPTGPSQEWSVGGGETPIATYIVANMGQRSDRFRLKVNGIPDEWAITSPPIELPPGSKGELSVQFDVPNRIDVTAGDQPISIRAFGLSHGAESNPLSGALQIGAFNNFVTYVDPISAEVGESVRVTVENQGNLLQTYNLAWHDTEDQLDFSPTGENLVLSPGESNSVSFNSDYRDGRPWFRRRKYPFKAIVSDTTGEIQTKEGQIVGRGCFPLWLLLVPLLCFVCAAIPALLQSRFDLGFELPNILPDIGLFGDSPFGQGDEEFAGNSALSADATRNAIAYETAAAENAQQEQLAAAATSNWLESDDDNDGLTNGRELNLGTALDKRDTDEDGLDDGEEENKWLTNPLSRDSDNDGVSDRDEALRGIDPNNPDTDGDGTIDSQDSEPGQKATPTPDATKTATAIAYATAQSGCYVDTGYDTLNLRSGPGETYEPPLTKLPNGARLKPLTYRDQGVDGKWIEVIVRGTNWRGWISNNWVKCNLDVTTLPSGQIPATPTVTAVPTTVPTATDAITDAPQPATATATSTAVLPIIEPVTTEASPTKTSTTVPAVITPLVTPTPVPPTPVPPTPVPPTDAPDTGNGPEPTQPPDADLDDIEEVYAALKLADVTTDKVNYSVGEPIVLTYSLVNTSDRQLKVPQPQQGAQPLVGTRQHWIERTDGDVTIPALAEDSRTGNQYRFKNEIIQATLLLPSDLISTQQSLDSTGFPSGGYLITVEYRSLAGELLDSEVVALDIE